MVESSNLPGNLYWELRTWLLERPVLYPRHISLEFPNGYEPKHLRCYDTARQVHSLTGWPVVAGIAFLDKSGKLFPWPHMVNLQGNKLTDLLVDASPTTVERNLGFVPIRLNETEAWNQITKAYQKFGAEAALGDRWGDPNADALTDEYYGPLVAREDAMGWELPVFEIPPSMPSLP
jgi:hypothetical protein